MDAETPDRTRTAADESFERVAPLIWDAIQAQRRADGRAVVDILQRLMHLGEKEFYGSLAVLAAMAVEGVPFGLVPGETWSPTLVAGRPPRRVDPDRDPAAGFALRFVAATLNRDEDFRLGVWRAFVERAVEGPGSERERATETAKALYLLLQLAARGLDRAERKQARTHQHPRAPRRKGRHR